LHSKLKTSRSAATQKLMVGTQTSFCSHG
jgi:hypothetical protein